MNHSPLSAVRILASITLAGAGLGSPAWAQGVPVILEGDPIAGAGPMNFAWELDMTVDGRWTSRVDTFFSSSQDNLILGPTGTLLQEGQSLPNPVGASIKSIEAYDSNALRDLVAVSNIAGVPQGIGDRGVIFNGELILRTGDPVTAAGVGVGTTFTYFDEVELNNSRQVLILCHLDDPAVPGTQQRSLIRFDLDDNGQILSQDLVIRVGDGVLGCVVQLGGIWPSANNSVLGEGGQALWVGYLGGSNSHGVIALDGTCLAESGTESPLSQHSWNGIGGASSVDLNANGDVAFTGNVHGPSLSGHLIVKNGAPAYYEGQSLPAIAPYVLVEFENSPIALTDDGRLAWYAEWNDPDTSRNSGIFLDDQLIVQKGVTAVGGSVVSAFEDNLYALDVAADGSGLLFEATLNDGSEGVFLYSLGELGSRYCESLPNSVAAGGARIDASGSTSVGANDLFLSAGPMQAGRPGVFIYGTLAGNGGAGTPFGDGLLCVAGGITRIAVVVSNGTGIMTHAVDNQSNSIAAGLTLFFQAWHRDPAGPGGTGFNLSDGLALVFVP